MEDPTEDLITEDPNEDLITNEPITEDPGENRNL